MKGRFVFPSQMLLVVEESRESPPWALLNIHNWLGIKLFHANLSWCFKSRHEPEIIVLLLIFCCSFWWIKGDFIFTPGGHVEATYDFRYSKNNKQNHYVPQEVKWSSTNRRLNGSTPSHACQRVRVNVYCSWWAVVTLYGNLCLPVYECVCERVNADMCCKALWVVVKTRSAS